LRSKMREKWGWGGARYSPFIDAGRPPLNERVDVLQVKDQCSPTIYMQPWLALWIMSHKGRSYTWLIGLAFQHTGEMWDNDFLSTHERSSTCIGHNVLVHLACGFDNMLMCKRHGLVGDQHVNRQGSGTSGWTMCCHQDTYENVG
jgi:hypothetical protein